MRAAVRLEMFSIGPLAVVPKLPSFVRSRHVQVQTTSTRIAPAPQPPAMIDLAGPECL